MPLYIVHKDELQHHGILGQKWGVRRFQNPNGSLTEAGKKRYYNPDGTLTKKGEKEYNKRNDRIERSMIKVVAASQTMGDEYVLNPNSKGSRFLKDAYEKAYSELRKEDYEMGVAFANEYKNQPVTMIDMLYVSAAGRAKRMTNYQYSLEDANSYSLYTTFMDEKGLPSISVGNDKNVKFHTESKDPSAIKEADRFSNIYDAEDAKAKIAYTTYENPKTREYFKNINENDFKSGLHMDMVSLNEDHDFGLLYSNKFDDSVKFIVYGSYDSSSKSIKIDDDHINSILVKDKG